MYVGIQRKCGRVYIDFPESMSEDISRIVASMEDSAKNHLSVFGQIVQEILPEVLLDESQTDTSITE